MNHPPLAGLALAPALAVVALAGAGCQTPVTEVVLVLDSDLAVPSEADSIQVTGDFVTPSGTTESQTGDVSLGGFPVSIGFVSTRGETSRFSVTVELDKIFVPTVQPIVVRRRITDIAFVREQTRMLIVSLSRACACQGTSCPSPGNPDCDDIASPDTEPFDPARAPPSSGSTGVIMAGGSSGGSTRPPPPTPAFDAGGVRTVDAAVRDAAGNPDLGAPDGGAADGATPDGDALDGGA